MRWPFYRDRDEGSEWGPGRLRWGRILARSYTKVAPRIPIIVGIEWYVLIRVGPWLGFVAWPTRWHRENYPSEAAGRDLPFYVRRHLYDERKQTLLYRPPQEPEP